MIKKVIYGLLNADATYKGAIGVDTGGNVKLYPSEAPQGVSRPYATYTYVSRTEDHNKDERGPITYSVQIDQWGVKETDAQEADEACIDALDHYKGTVSGIRVMSIRILDGSGGFNEKMDSRRRMSEFRVRIQP